MEPKQRILDEATRLFALRGYDGVGIQEILQAAELTKPTLYHHFGSKRGLLEAICEETCRDLWSRLAGPLQYEGDLPDTLQSSIDGFFRFAMANPEETRLFAALSQSPPEREGRQVIRPIQHALTDAVETMFRQAAEQHGNMRGRHTIYAASLLGTLFTFGLLVIDGTIAYEPDLAFRIMHQFSHGIYS